MADKPILFSAPMVRALLDGRKSQTRRVIKDRGHLPEFCAGRHDDKNDPSNYGWEDCERGEWITLDQFPRYNFVPASVGDRLWVREAWRSMDGLDGSNATEIAANCIEAGYRRPWAPLQYEADGARVNWIADPHSFGTDAGRYRHARFMPRWASRLTLIVTDARAQRLQEISEADAMAEGCEFVGDRNYLETPRDCFRDLWNSINGPAAWDANPWVAAYSFRVIRANIDSKEIPQ